MKVFISSVQKEFQKERKALSKMIASDVVLRDFFETFVFELDAPASNKKAKHVFLEEVAECEIYLGIFGDEYGSSDDRAGKPSPTHQEYLEAGKQNKQRIIFVKGGNDEPQRDSRMQSLIDQVSNEHTWHSFGKTTELIEAVKESLVQYLKDIGRIQHTPWDQRVARGASLDSIEPEAVARFVRHARTARNLDIAEGTHVEEVLAHLDLIRDTIPTNPAILLFGKNPQRTLPSSVVKCMQFYGTEVSKPLQAQQNYEGTAFELVDQVLDFVLTRINAGVGTRAKGAQAPIRYEIPRDVVAEAIINAVAHRDYNSHASIQVMLFSDRLEIHNPGRLPRELSLDKLRKPHSSYPRNERLAKALYLTQYIESVGTGIRDMINNCSAANLPDPDFSLQDGFRIMLRRPVTPPVAPPVTPPVRLVLLIAEYGPIGNSEMLEYLNLKDRKHLRMHYINPALSDQLIERTIPENPTSRLQKYRLTEKGKKLLQTVNI